MKLKHIITSIALGAIVLFYVVSCAKPRQLFVQPRLETVTTAVVKDTSVAAFLEPYRDSLRAAMGKVIGYTPVNMERNRPESILGNFMLDETLKFALRKGYADSTTPTISMMNHGGMRSPIRRGNITIGDVFGLMPFDNLIVVAKLPKSALDQIVQYNRATGGEPIAGFTIHNDEIRPLGFNAFGDTIEIVTTDYLFNGGDKMDFFSTAYSSFNTGVLLRDALIEQVQLADTVNVTIDQRIIFDNE
jgi:2',3'-cyclic-nucleotide 2'-phosphodiesterase (5'-nucleotidase family)